VVERQLDHPREQQASASSAQPSEQPSGVVNANMSAAAAVRARLGGKPAVVSPTGATTHLALDSQHSTPSCTGLGSTLALSPTRGQVNLGQLPLPVACSSCRLLSSESLGGAERWTSVHGVGCAVAPAAGAPTSGNYSAAAMLRARLAGKPMPVAVAGACLLPDRQN
jgi:hypothetical protein